MENRLSRWGVGPRIAAVALGYAALAVLATHRWPEVCRIRLVPDVIIVATGCILLAAGVLMLVVAARALNRAYKRDELVTSGVFALVRHPIYSAWIVLIVPGLALLSRSWLQLLTPLVAYSVFKLLIHQEDEYLERRFGAAYLNYRARLSELIPVPQFRHRRRRPSHA